MPLRPIDAAKACIQRSRELLDVAQDDTLNLGVRNDLRRSALAMAVTALDAYMHWLVYRRISEVRTRGDLPKSWTKLSLPSTDIAALADATIEGRNKGVLTRPWVQVKNAMQKQLLTETFQSFDQVGRAFAWAGIKKPWKSVADEMSTTAAVIESRLNSLVHRRNQIVHEGDLVRALRPQSLRYNAVSHAQVVDDVDWLDGLIDAIGKVVSN